MAVPKRSDYKDNIFLFFSIFAGTIGAISNGMHIGFSGASFYPLQNVTFQIPLEDDENMNLQDQYQHDTDGKMLIKTFYLFGALIGIPITILCNKLGFKIVTAINSAIAFTSWILTASTTSCIGVNAAWILAGMSTAFTLITVPQYLSEIIKRNTLDWLKNIVYDLILIGILLVYLLVPITPILVIPSLGAFVTGLQLLLSFFMSESPYFLVSKKKHLEAQAVLERLRKGKFDDSEINIITKVMIREKRDRRYVKLFSPIENRRASLSVIVTIIAQQFTGITAIFMSFHELLHNCDITHIYPISIIFILLIMIMEYLNKSKLFQTNLKSKIIAAVICTLALLTLAIYLNLKNRKVNMNELTYIPMISFIVFGVAFKFDKGYLPMEIVDNYYPDSIKSTGLTFTTFVQVLAAWISIELFQRLKFYIVLYIFVCLNVVSTIFIVYYLPPMKKKDTKWNYSGTNYEMASNPRENFHTAGEGTELFEDPETNTDKMTVAVTSESIFKGTFPQLIAVLAGTLTAVSDGMQYGWTSPVLPILLGPNSPVKVTTHQGEWLETLLMLGSFSGLSITMYLVDKIGRKRSILLATFVTIMIWVVTAVAPRVEYIFAARAFAGSAGNMAFVATPMYIAEIAEQKIRGFLSSIIYLMMLVGIFIIYAVAPYIPFYAHCVLGASLAFVQLVVFPFMPESPYYLLHQNKEEEARKSLKRLRAPGRNIDKELEDIKAAVTRQKTEKGRLLDLFLVPSNRMGLIIMAILNTAQHFSSISVLLMNVHIVLESADSIYVESRIAAIMFSVIMLLAATVASFCIDKFGRKTLLIGSSISSSLCLLVLAIYFSLKNSGHDTASVSWIPIVCVMLYAMFFKLGLGMVPIVLTAELFPTKMKAYGMTLADGFYVIAALLSLQVYQRLKESFGLQYPFYVFSFSCIVAAIFTYFFIPETKGKTLEEIQMILKGAHNKEDKVNKDLVEEA